MSDERNTSTENPEDTFGTDPEESGIKPLTLGLMPYYVIVSIIALIAIMAAWVVLYGSDPTDLVGDGDADISVENPTDEMISAPTAVNEEKPAVTRLAGIDASECDLSQIEMKDGALVIERDCLKIVFEDKDVIVITASP